MPKLILANESNLSDIMIIVNDAKTYLKNQGSKQWNLPDGYPDETTILNDIKRNECYLYIEDNNIIGTMSIIEKTDENYNEINGSWLTNNPYASIHRIAIKNTHHKKNVGVKMLLEAEEIVKSKNLYSIKIDTHNRNIPMTKTILKAGYTYCELSL